MDPDATEIIAETAEKAVTVNGAERLRKFIDPRPSVADAVAARFAKYTDTATDDVDDDEDDFQAGNESGEDDIPSPCTSIKETYFAVDPRPPLTVYLCKPKESRLLYLASSDIQRKDVHRYGVYLAKARTGKLHLLCIRRPSVSGNDWPGWAAMRRLVKRAQKLGGWWVTDWREQPSGRFKLFGGPAPARVTDPVTFPEASLEELILLGFGERVVESADDPRLPEVIDLSNTTELA